MRVCCCVLSLVVLSGCGKESTPSRTEAAPQAGLPLSIEAPTEQPAEVAAVVPALTDEQQTAVAQLVVRARDALASGQTAVAVEALSQAIGVNPAGGELYRLRADVYAVSGELANARADFGAAILAEPGNAELRNVRGYFLMSHGLHDEAMADLDEAIRLEPGLAVAWNNRGLVYLQQQDYATAQKQFQKAVECDADYVDGWNNLGFARMKQDQLSEAAQDIQRALDLHPDYLAAWNNMGLIRLRLKDFEAAVQAFGETVRLAPMDARWYAHRKVALTELQRFDEAARDQQKIDGLVRLTQATQHLNQNPQDPVRWMARAEALVHCELLEEAVSSYAQVLQLQPQNTMALNRRASVLVQQQRYTEAVEDCTVSLQIAESVEALSVRGDAWLGLNDLDRALDNFTQAGRMDDVVVQAYLDRAADHEKHGEKQEAAQDRQAARQMQQALAGQLVLTGNSDEPIPFPESAQREVQSVSVESAPTELEDFVPLD